MVSSKWISGESPSPFVLTAPLIPPWAQTEWLRLTGTTEKRSTAAPISAARTVAIRPASPPPTMTMRSLGDAIGALHPKRGDRAHSDHRQDDKERGGHVHHAALRP